MSSMKQHTKKWCNITLLVLLLFSHKTHSQDVQNDTNVFSDGDTTTPNPPRTTTTTCLNDKSQSSILIDKSSCDPTNETLCLQNCGPATLYNTTYLLRASKCCAHVGTAASLLAFEDDAKWLPRLKEYNDCTGASVTLTYVEGGEDGMAEALKRDVEEEGLFDAYIVQAPWIPPVTEGLANLSPLVREVAEYVDFLDINAASRSAVTYNGTIKAFPLDSDYIALGWREDVFLKHGVELKAPETIEELVELSERLNGLDHNEDGVPDWGFCLTPQVNYFYAFVAPVFQTFVVDKETGENTGQNLFFDVDTFEPLIHAPGFKYALSLYWRFILASNCQEQLALGEKCSRKTAFPTGRCAGVISMPGTMNNLLKTDGRYAPRPRTDANDTNITWAPGWNLPPERHWGRRAVFPGSHWVQPWHRVTKKGEVAYGSALVECLDASVCPYAREGVNYAPFFAEGGESYALNGRQSKPRATRVMWDMFTWLAELPVTELPLSGQYRKSHLNDEHREQLSEKGWPKVMIDDLFGVLKYYFADDGNQVQDLLLLGFSEYMEALHDELHKNLLFRNISEGGIWNFENVSLSIQPGVDTESFDALHDRFVTALEQKYDVVTKEIDGGGLSQLRRWRESLNLVWKSPENLCANLMVTERYAAFDKLNCAVEVSFESLCATMKEQVDAYNPKLCVTSNKTMVTILIAVGSVLALIVLGFVSYYAYNQYKSYRRIAEAHERLMEDTLDAAMRSLTLIEYPLHLIKASDFIKGRRFIRHENLRNSHKLFVIDTLKDVDKFIDSGNEVVFFSHQWTSFTAPDYSGTQFQSAITALQKLVERNGWDPSLENVYVWVDYSCIPQANQSVQSLAIRSLATYASSATYFVVIAPSVSHAQLETTCDVTTYQNRVWCRAEQVCHSMRNGVDRMFLAVDDPDKGGLVLIDDEWFKQSLRVFDGELTCCRLEHKGMGACDRESLVIPLLGLFGELYRASVEVKSESVEAFLKDINDNQVAIFPREFKRVSWRKKKRVEETIMLFGDLIERMKKRIDLGEDIADVDKDRDRDSSTFIRHGVIHGVIHGANPDAGQNSDELRRTRHRGDSDNESNSVEIIIAREDSFVMNKKSCSPEREN